MYSTHYRDIKNGNVIAKEALELKINDISLNTALIDFYAIKGDLYNMELIFNSIENKDTQSYNSMMNGYKINQKYKNSLKIFEEMQLLYPSQLTSHTYSIALYCYTESNQFIEGKKIIVKLCQDNNSAILNDIYVKCALMNFHGKCNSIQSGLDLFNTYLNHESKSTNILSL